MASKPASQVTHPKVPHPVTPPPAHHDLPALASETAASAASLFPPRHLVPPRWVAISLAVILGAAGLVMFALVADKRGAIFDTGELKGQPVIFHYDQHAYLNAARLLATRPDYVMPRFRTPGLPWMLSFLYEPGHAHQKTSPKDPREVTEAYFTLGKLFAIGLAAVCLVALFFFVRLWLPLWESFLFTWTAAWLLFVFKVPYIRPEIPFYTLFFISSVLCMRLLRRPSWWLAPLTGALMAGTYLLKSAVLPLAALFLACLGLKILWNVWRERRAAAPAPLSWGATLRRAGKELGLGLLLPAVFFTCLFPYLRNTARLHDGNPFYSIHSSVYMWMDSRQQKLDWHKDIARGDHSSTPSARTYWETHTLGEILERPREGARKTLHRIRNEYFQLHVFTLGGLGLAAGWLVLLHRARIWAALRERWVPALFLAGCLLGFAAVYGWYDKLAMGPRGMLSLYLFLPFGVLWALSRYGAPFSLARKGLSFDVRQIGLAFLTLHLAIATGFVIASDAWTLSGGG